MADTMVVNAAPPEATRNGSGTEAALEHLHLHMRRTHWETKAHSDLGPHLQDALDKLDAEGWRVVTAFTVDRTPEIILQRHVQP